MLLLYISVELKRRERNDVLKEIHVTWGSFIFPVSFRKLGIEN